jgi:hypothetical protein
MYDITTNCIFRPFRGDKQAGSLSEMGNLENRICTLDIICCVDGKWMELAQDLCSYWLLYSDIECLGCATW